jgi:hypothetical protein
MVESTSEHYYAPVSSYHELCWWANSPRRYMHYNASGLIKDSVRGMTALNKFPVWVFWETEVWCGNNKFLCSDPIFNHRPNKLRNRNQ